MALIYDPDSLHQGTEVTINTGAKTIGLNIAGTLSTDGVTLKCLYSFLKEEWNGDANLIKYPFPLLPITDEQFELMNGWDFANDATRYLIRTGGWAVKNAAGVSLEEWAGVVTLGSIGASDQVYFQQVANGAAANFQLTGPVNQAVKVYGDGTHGSFDRRGYMKLYVREYQKSYANSALTDIGVTVLSYQVYRFPLANATDLKITHDDTTVDTTAPYTGMSITWYGTPQAVNIGGTSYNFHVIIDGNNGYAEEIYEFVQRQLRKATDIDAGAGTKTGTITSRLLTFTGENLATNSQAEGGVYITNFLASDTNRLTFTDDNGDPIVYPYVAALTIQFGENLVNDASAKYWVYFTNDDAGLNLGADYGTSGAIIVQDAGAVPMTGTIGGVSSVSKSFAYDSNIQRGAASAGKDAPITVVAIGLDTAQFVKATGTIAKSTANGISLVASLERNYVNP